MSVAASLAFHVDYAVDEGRGVNLTVAINVSSVAAMSSCRKGPMANAPSG
jgi:hypothetical protein